MSHLSPGDEVICHPYAHIYNYEGGGIAANAMLPSLLRATIAVSCTQKEYSVVLKPTMSITQNLAYLH